MDVLAPDGAYMRSAGKKTDQRATSSISIRLVTAWAGGGGWTKTVNEPRFTARPLCVLRQVSDLVLIDPIPEDIFEEELWKEYW